MPSGVVSGSVGKVVGEGVVNLVVEGGVVVEGWMVISMEDKASISSMQETSDTVLTMIPAGTILNGEMTIGTLIPSVLLITSIHSTRGPRFNK